MNAPCLCEITGERQIFLHGICLNRTISDLEQFEGFD